VGKLAFQTPVAYLITLFRLKNAFSVKKSDNLTFDFYPNGLKIQTIRRNRGIPRSANFPAENALFEKNSQVLRGSRNYTAPTRANTPR
jgi:hypothetical protein